MANNLMAATNALPQVLVSTRIAATETTQYTTPASTSVKIANVTLTNTVGANITVSVSLVKSSGTAGADNRVLFAYPLVVGDSTVLNELVGHVLGPGDFISAIASSATSVVFTMSGVVFS